MARDLGGFGSGSCIRDQGCPHAGDENQDDETGVALPEIVNEESEKEKKIRISVQNRIQEPAERGDLAESSGHHPVEEIEES